MFLPKKSRSYPDGVKPAHGLIISVIPIKLCIAHRKPNDDGNEAMDTAWVIIAYFLRGA